MATIIAPFSLIVLAPAGVLGLALGALRPFRNHRTVLSFLLPGLLCLYPAVSALRDRMEPGRRFLRMTGAALPAHRSGMSCFFSGGGLADIRDEFEFTTTPEETDALIKQLDLLQADTPGSTALTSLPPTFVRPQQWHQKGKTGSVDFIALYTDETHTWVKIAYMTI
ncbi:MAG: hypothetical protein QM755_00870 [Luteolibacter sp.]